jgi:hypothetical protein
MIVSVAVAVAAAYLIALAWRRQDWAESIRKYNVALGAGICLLALFLALPIVNFGAISARDQLAMLESGRIAPEEFDWRAMRFDFGPSGRRALERLRDQGRSPTIRDLAANALREEERWRMDSADDVKRKRAAVAEIRVLPRPVALPPALVEAVSEPNHCTSGEPCFVFFEAGATRAVVVSGPYCPPDPPGATIIEDRCFTSVSALSLTRRGWIEVDADDSSRDHGKADLEALLRNPPEIRPVTRRQVFIGDRPVGEAFE